MTDRKRNREEIDMQLTSALSSSLDFLRFLNDMRLVNPGVTSALLSAMGTY